MRAFLSRTFTEVYASMLQLHGLIAKTSKTEHYNLSSIVQFKVFSFSKTLGKTLATCLPVLAIH